MNYADYPKVAMHLMAIEEAVDEKYPGYKKLCAHMRENLTDDQDWEPDSEVQSRRCEV